MINTLESPWARRGSYLIFALLTLYVLLTFNHYGLSNDEEVQHVYGRLLLDFYGSGLQDMGAFNYKNLYLYGGLFDIIAAAFEKLVPMDVWDLRHLISAVFGLLGLLGTWKVAKLLGGERLAFLAVLLLGVTGAWTGAMFTHTKDVPFGTTMIWAVYYSIRFVSSLPRPSWALIIKLGLAIGLAFGLRVGAVFSVFYLGMGVLAWSLCSKNAGEFIRRLLGAVLHLLPAALVALVVMGLCWPWSVMGWDHLYQAATTFNHFSFDLFTIVDGVVTKNGEVPRTYLLSYLLVRLPEITLLGLGLAGIGLVVRVGLRDQRAGQGLLLWLPLLLAAVVPLTYTLLGRPSLYNGVRHFTFLLPPLSILGAWGWLLLWERCQGFMCKGLGLVLLVLTALPVYHMVRLHPYEYIAYNQFVGGLPGAAKGWELDYWSGSLREGAQQLNSLVDQEDDVRDEPYPVAVCAETIQGTEYLDPRLFVVTKDWYKADFFLSTTHMGCNTAMQGEQIGGVSREGVPLMVVLDRRQLHPHQRHPR